MTLRTEYITKNCLFYHWSYLIWYLSLIYVLANMHRKEFCQSEFLFVYGDDSHKPFRVEIEWDYQKWSQKLISDSMTSLNIVTWPFSFFTLIVYFIYNILLLFITSTSVSSVKWLRSL